MPIMTPPSTWPSAPTSLMIVPESCEHETSSTRTTPVSRSSFTRTAWQLTCGAVQASMPSLPTQFVLSVSGPSGTGPEPVPSSSSPPWAVAASSASATLLSGEPLT